MFFAVLFKAPDFGGGAFSGVRCSTFTSAAVNERTLGIFTVNLILMYLALGGFGCFFVTRANERNPDFLRLDHVNNVHVTAGYVTTEEETALFLQKENKFFIINISLCFYTKVAKREKFACRETTFPWRRGGFRSSPSRARPRRPSRLLVFAFSGVPCV